VIGEIARRLAFGMRREISRRSESTNPWPTEKLPPPSTWPPVRVPTILASPFSVANAATISPALNVCSLTSMTMRPWDGFDPRPSVMSRIERSRWRTRNRTASLSVSSLVRGRCVSHRARRPARHPGTSEPRPVRRPAHLRRPARGLRIPGAVEDGHALCLKTIIPSRNATKEYLGEDSDDEA
jgi:hypothetical protein